MNKDKGQYGFTIVETMIVVAIVAVLLAFAGGISSKFAERRSVDDTANKITSELNLIKLQAARDGVQYRTTVDFDEAEGTITIEKTRGDSNRTSSFATIDPISVENYNINNNYIMDNVQYIMDFNPNGTSVAATTLNLRPVEGSSISKCARIQVTQFGVIRTVIGRWDFETSNCNIISNQQESLEESS